LWALHVTTCDRGCPSAVSGEDSSSKFSSNFRERCECGPAL